MLPISTCVSRECAQAGHEGIRLDDNRALICGGYGPVNGVCRTLSDCYIYDARADMWTMVKPLAQARLAHGFSRVNGLVDTHTYGYCTCCGWLSIEDSLQASSMRSAASIATSTSWTV